MVTPQTTRDWGNELLLGVSAVSIPSKQSSDTNHTLAASGGFRRFLLIIATLPRARVEVSSLK